MRFRIAHLKDALGIARVHVESWQTTYKRILPASFLEQLSLERRKKLWEDNISANNTVIVAETSDQEIIGFTSGGKEHTEKYPDYKGELYAIYILKEFQGLGVGKNLMQLLAQDLSKLGYPSMLTWVLDKNNAYDFYKQLDGDIIAQKSIDIAGVTLNESAFGWKNLQQFVIDA